MDKILRSASLTRRILNLWPPFWGAGIGIQHLSNDFTQCKVQLKFRWWNKNANRTQFGGSMFAMTDPIYPLMLMGALENRYFVCDQSACIEFVKPGKGKLFADFELSEQDLLQIKQATANGEKYLPKLNMNVIDEQGEIVARIERTIYIRLKTKYRPQLEQAA